MGQKGSSTRKDQSRRYYEKHRDEVLAKARKRREAKREALNQAKREHRLLLQERACAVKDRPCMDCGLEWPSYVMEFDHVRGEKIAAVARLVADRCSFEMLDAEIAKCDVVCSNCHRIRTHLQKQCGDLLG